MKRPLAVAGLLSPAAALLLLGFVVPMAWLVRLSLDRSEEGGVLVPDLTVANYANFAHDSFYLGILARTLVLGVTVALLTLICAYPIALFLYRLRSRWRGLLVILTISPMLVGSVVRTFGWMAILGERGFVNQTLQTLGITAHPFALMNNMLGVVIGLVQIEMPVMALALIAGLSRLDPTLEQAAQTLGARPWRAFLRVTLPLSAPGIVLGCLITFVQVISSFITPTLLGGGRIYLMATTIYEEALETLNWPLAATISIILIAVFALCALVYERFGTRAAQ
jgi:putative spermidine/putrescine transport system permease protein